MSRFDEKARDWDTPERVERARALAAFIREHVSLSPSMRVIDIGAGTGLLGLELAADVGEMVLAEPSTGMLEIARQKLAGATVTNVSVTAYDVSRDPPPGEPFDLAVSLLVLHHVTDTGAALRSIHDLLVPRGRIALADLDAEDGTFHSEDAEGIEHHGFERTAIVRLAESVGFDKVGTRTAISLERDGRSYPLFLLTGRRRRRGSARRPCVTFVGQGSADQDEEECVACPDTEPSARSS